MGNLSPSPREEGKWEGVQQEPMYIQPAHSPALHETTTKIILNSQEQHCL